MATSSYVPNVNLAGNLPGVNSNAKKRRAGTTMQCPKHDAAVTQVSDRRCGSSSDISPEHQVLDLLPLVRRMAVKIRRSLPAHIELDDLVGSGMLGLLDATQKYDSQKRVKIESYARHRIRGAILDGLRSLDTVSRDLRKKNKRIERTIRELEMKLGRAAEDEETARSLGTSLEKWHQDLQELQSAGMDWPRPVQAKDTRLVNAEDLVAVNQPSQFDLCFLRERRDIATRAMACLPNRERKIITLYHAHDMTMKEIGARLRIDESRVSQLHSSAIERLRSTVRAILSRPRYAASPPHSGSPLPQRPQCVPLNA
jgi:RNA polymerase sigma factor FliA